jgi:hypothetical protein
VWRAIGLRVKFATKAARSRYATATGHQQLSFAETERAVCFDTPCFPIADLPRQFPASLTGAEFIRRRVRIGKIARKSYWTRVKRRSGPGFLPLAAIASRTR